MVTCNAVRRSFNIIPWQKKDLHHANLYGCSLARTGIYFLFSSLILGGSSWRLIFGALFGADFRTFAAGIELRKFSGFSAGQEQSRHVERRCERHRCRDQFSAVSLFGHTVYFRSAQPVRLFEQLLHVMGGVAGSGGHSLQALHPHPRTIARVL